MFLILLIMGLLSVLAIEAPRLVMKKMWRELAVFISLWLLGSYISYAIVTGIEVPNPTHFINAIFRLRS